MAGLTLTSARRRFVLLTALRELPTGLTVPVTVLLASSRGLTPVEIGLAFSAHGVVVVLLELPTGGLGDTLGRRPVLLLSGSIKVVALLLFVVAQTPLAFMLAFAVVGVGRALDSGPLESWYVDAVQEVDPSADTTAGLSRAGVAQGAGLAVGAIGGGLLPLLSGAGLALPYWVAAGLVIVQLAFVARLVVPVGPVSVAVGPIATLQGGLRNVPRVVKQAVALARRDRALRLLLGMAAGTGAALVTIELLAPLRFEALTGGAAEASGAYGVVVALGFAGAAAGSGLAPAGRRLWRGSAAKAIATASVAGAVVMLGLGLAGTVALLGAGFAAFYLCNGAGWPLRQQLLHTRVSAEHRSSMVSVMSLALQVGGLVMLQVAPRLFAVEPELAFGAAAAVLLLLAVVALRLPDERPVEPDPYATLRKADPPAGAAADPPSAMTPPAAAPASSASPATYAVLPTADLADGPRRYVPTVDITESHDARWVAPHKR